MALKAGPLVVAHWRGVWNQAARESGQGAKIGGAIVVGVVVFLVPIAVMLFRIAASTGASLAAGGDADVFAFWAGEQALFAVFFPLFGSVRMKPAFPVSRFGRFPVTPMELLLAEVPAGMVEVFPILGIGALVVTNAGLASAMPAMIPAIAVVAVISICSFIATLFIASAAFALLARSRVVTLLAIFTLFGGVAYTGVTGIRGVFRGLKVAINVWLPAVVKALPLTRGYQGVFALHRGQTAEGAGAIAFYGGVTLLLVAIAAVIHARRLTVEQESARWRLARPRELRFKTPAEGIGAVYVRQILGSSEGRASVAIAVIMTAIIAFMFGILRAVELEGKAAPEDLATFIHRVQSLPWFLLLPLFVIVAIGSQIWTNQFGFDAGSMRGILTLPIRPEQLVLGKTIGISKLVALQLGAAMIPVLAFTPPTVRQLLAGAAVAVVATVMVAMVGQLLSVRFPRRFAGGTSGPSIPLYLSWIPLALMIVLGDILFVAHVMGELVVRGGGDAVLVVIAAGSCLLYRASLPWLAGWMTVHRERLLTM